MDMHYFSRQRRLRGIVTRCRELEEMAAGLRRAASEIETDCLIKRLAAEAALQRYDVSRRCHRMRKRLGL